MVKNSVCILLIGIFFFTSSVFAQTIDESSATSTPVSFPKIVTVKPTASSSSIDIAVRTDRLTNAKVIVKRIGGTPLSDLTIFEPSFVAKRTVHVGGLEGSSQYSYVLTLSDASGHAVEYSSRIATARAPIVKKKKVIAKKSSKKKRIIHKKSSGKARGK